MTTLNSKAKGKSRKTSDAGKAVKTKNVTTGKSSPTEEEIRKKAKEIYQERIERGEHGTAVDDWIKAEQLFSGSKK